MEKENLTFQEKIIKIQTQLKVKKEKFNSFGGYYSRSAENILEDLKPFQAELGLTIKLEDEVLMVGPRFYIKSTATLSDGKDSIQASAHAREPDSPKAKMDESQTTGSATSYARKYALNGLLALDDGQDSDTEEKKVKTKAQKVVAENMDEVNNTINKITAELRKQCSGMNNDEKVGFIQKMFGVESVKALSKKPLVELQAKLKVLEGMSK